MKRLQEAVDDVDREIYSLLKGATLRGASNSATKTSVVSLQLSVNIKVESCLAFNPEEGPPLKRSEKNKNGGRDGWWMHLQRERVGLNLI